MDVPKITFVSLIDPAGIGAAVAAALERHGLARCRHVTYSRHPYVAAPDIVLDERVDFPEAQSALSDSLIVLIDVDRHGLPPFGPLEMAVALEGRPVVQMLVSEQAMFFPGRTGSSL